MELKVSGHGLSDATIQKVIARIKEHIENQNLSKERPFFDKYYKELGFPYIMSEDVKNKLDKKIFFALNNNQIG